MDKSFQAEGNEAKQKALYIELMVQHYKDEIRAGEELEMILKTEERGLKLKQLLKQLKKLKGMRKLQELSKKKMREKELNI